MHVVYRIIYSDHREDIGHLVQGWTSSASKTSPLATTAPTHQVRSGCYDWSL
jgi:hypothetical protein